MTSLDSSPKGEPAWVAALLEAAQKEGFASAGIVDIDLAQSLYQPHAERLKSWLSHGAHGDMAYLERGLERRTDVRKVFPSAESVFVVLDPYHPLKNRSPDSLWFASYLEGSDYHGDLSTRLERVLQWGRESEPLLQGKVCVDTSAVLERAWASLAGLGWIGKNSMLLSKELGSYTFIGVLLLNLKSHRGPRSSPDLCGQCRACLDQCPTNAFVAPRVLDARRCVSYLTLEKRGAFSEAEAAELRKAGRWVAGCDVCQDVCPFNRKTLQSRGEDAGEAEWTRKLGSPDRAATISAVEYQALVENSALNRIRASDFSRNVSISADVDEPNSK